MTKNTMTREDRIVYLQLKQQAEGGLSEQDAMELQNLSSGTTGKAGISVNDTKNGQEGDQGKASLLARAWGWTKDVALRVWNAIVRFYQFIARQCVNAWKASIGKLFGKKQAKTTKTDGKVIDITAVAV